MLLQPFSLHPMDQQEYSCCHNFLTVTWSYNSKNTPIGGFYAVKLAKSVFLFVFTMAFPTSLFKINLIESTSPPLPLPRHQAKPILQPIIRKTLIHLLRTFLSSWVFNHFNYLSVSVFFWIGCICTRGEGTSGRVCYEWGWPV